MSLRQSFKIATTLIVFCLLLGFWVLPVAAQDSDQPDDAEDEQAQEQPEEETDEAEAEEDAEDEEDEQRPTNRPTSNTASDTPAVTQQEVVEDIEDLSTALALPVCTEVVRQVPAPIDFDVLGDFVLFNWQNEPIDTIDRELFFYDVAQTGFDPLVFQLQAPQGDIFNFGWVDILDIVPGESGEAPQTGRALVNPLELSQEAKLYNSFVVFYGPNGQPLCRTDNDQWLQVGFVGGGLPVVRGGVLSDLVGILAPGGTGVASAGGGGGAGGGAGSGSGGGITPPPVTNCGNGAIDAGEVCDDGILNGVAGNCNSTCTAILPPSATCGDGNPDPGEVCDDGNTVSGDGCNATCTSNETCDNGIVDTAAGETCDDGLSNGTVPGGCNATCNGIVPLPTCGDGNPDPGEVCDDGNTVSGDGCNATCTSNETCNNGIVDTAAGETCDDGATNGTVVGGCNATCDGLVPAPTCGDGNLDPGEVCDDGNTVSGDGCNATCTSDETCGNSFVDPGETCDDGNTTSADGCDATCQVEDPCRDIEIGGADPSDPAGPNFLSECATGHTIDGDAGNNSLVGGAGNDSISGLAGDDTLLGLGGNDTLDGGDNEDVVDGGPGDDSVYGGAGNDTVNGGDNNDIVDGGDGDDLVNGGPGDDTLVDTDGSVGSDTLFGGTGNDLAQTTLDGDVAIITAAGGDATLDYGGQADFYRGVDSAELTGSGYIYTILESSHVAFDIDDTGGEYNAAFGQESLQVAESSPFDPFAADMTVNYDAPDTLTGVTTVRTSSLYNDEFVFYSTNGRTLDADGLGAGFDVDTYRLRSFGTSTINIADDGTATATNTDAFSSGTDNLSGFEIYDTQSFNGSTELPLAAQINTEDPGDNTFIMGAAGTNDVLNIAMADTGAGQQSIEVNRTGTSGTAVGDGVGNDTFSGVDSLNVTGSTVDDLIVVNDNRGNEIDGDTGTDTYDLSDSTANLEVSVDAVGDGSITSTTSGVGTDTLTSIEGIRTGTGQDTFNNDGANNYFDAGGNTDVLDISGAAGDSTIDLNGTGMTTTSTGAAGNDTLAGFENVVSGTNNDVINIEDLGNNSIVGGGGDDTYNAQMTTAGTVTVNKDATTDNGTVSGSGVGSDTVTDVDYISVTGTSGNDSFVVNDADNNTFDGTSTSDSDTYNVSGVDDDVTVNVDPANGVASTGPGNEGLNGVNDVGIDSLINIENYTTGSGNDTFTVDDARVNVLNAGAGTSDTIVLVDPADAVVRLDTTSTSTATNPGAVGLDTLIGFENVTTAGGNDSIFVRDSQDNVIDGAGGTNTLSSGFNGAGSVTVTYDNTGTGGTIDGAPVGSDTFANIQSVGAVGTGGNDTIAYDYTNLLAGETFTVDRQSATDATVATGSATNDVENIEQINVTGTGFDDTFVMLDEGNNNLDAGAGNDLYDISGVPTTAGGNTINIDGSGATTVTGTGIGTDILTGFESFATGDADDYFMITDSGDNYVDGGGHVNGDTVDMYLEGTGDDTVTVVRDTGNNSISVVEDNGTPNETTGDDTLVDIEFFNITGNDGDNSFVMDDESDNIVDGGDENLGDTYDVSAATNPVEVALADGDTTVTGTDVSTTGGDTLRDIERIVTGTGADSFLANDLNGDRTLDGNVGADSYEFAGSTDVIVRDGLDGVDTDVTVTDNGGTESDYLENMENIETGGGDDTYQFSTTNSRNLDGDDDVTGDLYEFQGSGGDSVAMTFTEQTDDDNPATSDVGANVELNGNAGTSDNIYNFESYAVNDQVDELVLNINVENLGDLGSPLNIDSAAGNTIVNFFGHIPNTQYNGNITISDTANAGGGLALDFSGLTFDVGDTDGLDLDLDSGNTNTLFSGMYGGNNINGFTLTVNRDVDEVIGTTINDDITASTGGTSIVGDAGDDTLTGRGGNDALIGGDDNDLLHGGDGDDTIDGGTGNDTLDEGDATTDLFIDAENGVMTGRGADGLTAATIENVITGDGADTVVLQTGVAGVAITGSTSNDGADSVVGSSGDDTILTLAGDDTIESGAGADSIDAGDGADLILSDAGADTVYAGDGADTVDAGTEADLVYGGEGDDSIDGGTGNDTLYGGLGSDTVKGGANNDYVYGDNNLGSDSTDPGTDVLYGGLGEDVIRDNGTGGGTIFGGSDAGGIADGADNIAFSGSGAGRVVYGGNDNAVGGDIGDTIIDNSSGSDTIFGGNRGVGADQGDQITLNSSSGDNNVVYGGNQNLSGTGADGADTITVQDSDGNTVYGGNLNDGGNGDDGADKLTVKDSDFAAIYGGNNNVNGNGNDVGGDTLTVTANSSTSGGTIYGGNDNSGGAGTDGNDEITFSGDVGTVNTNVTIYGGSNNTDNSCTQITCADGGDTILDATGQGDTIFGGNNNDGGSGNDNIGGDDDITITSGISGSTVYGGNNNANGDGNDGDDVLDEVVSSSTGTNISLTGGNLNVGGNGDDGNDDIRSLSDNATITGGNINSGGDGEDGSDTILTLGDSAEVVGGNNNAGGGVGDDTIGGDDITILGDGNNSVVGGNNNSAGGTGSDGDDTINVNSNGADTVIGGNINTGGGTGDDGNDVINDAADSATDVIVGDNSGTGGTGDDTIDSSGAGGDSITGENAGNTVNNPNDDVTADGTDTVTDP